MIFRHRHPIAFIKERGNWGLGGQNSKKVKEYHSKTKLLFRARDKSDLNA